MTEFNATRQAIEQARWQQFFADYDEARRPGFEAAVQGALDAYREQLEPVVQAAYTQGRDDGLEAASDTEQRLSAEINLGLELANKYARAGYANPVRHAMRVLPAVVKYLDWHLPSWTSQPADELGLGNPPPEDVQRLRLATVVLRTARRALRAAG